MKRPAGRAAAPGSFQAALYDSFVGSYASRSAGLQDLGSGKHCRSHCGRAIKKDGKITFLACRLAQSTPPCTWRAVLKEQADGTAELYQHASLWRSHIAGAKTTGTRGFESLAERKVLEAALAQKATSRPRLALRSGRTNKQQPVQKAQLKQVQNLRKGLCASWYGRRTVGDLRRAVQQCDKLPEVESQAYWCHSSIVRKGPKSEISILATTPALQRRFARACAAGCVVAADGGFKFNLLGWPLTVLGCLNPAGEFGLCALALTSDMESERMVSTLTAFAQSTARLAQSKVSAPFSMSDAEPAYRSALKSAFDATNLMCYFHVKHAARDSFYKRFKGSKDEKEVAWSEISLHIDLMRQAQSQEDFVSRANAVKAKWCQDGLEGKTAWKDKLGRNYNWVSSFFRQWLDKVGDWHLAVAADLASAPSTNNAAESTIKYTRQDAGNVVGSVGETLNFMLEQVEVATKAHFDPTAPRHVDAQLWQKAASFQSLFGTDKIRSVTLDTRKLLEGGQETTVEILLTFHGGLRGDQAFCTCPAFPAAKRCFHVLALNMHLGKCKVPDELDSTPLGAFGRGNKPKAPGRGSVPLKADDKDLLITSLREQLRKAKAKNKAMGQETTVKAAGHKTSAPPVLHDLRRCRRKTTWNAAPQIVPSDIDAEGSQTAAVLNVRVLYSVSADGNPVLKTTDPVNKIVVEDVSVTLGTELSRLFQSFGAPAAAVQDHMLKACSFLPDGKLETTDVYANQAVRDVLSISDTVLLQRK
ncbi:unnamed protein product, partial [Symbiodinium sp. CCMP2592]